MKGLATGDLCHSMKRTQTVKEIIADSFPVSARLGLLSLGFAILFGVGSCDFNNVVVGRGSATINDHHQCAAGCQPRNHWIADQREGAIAFVIFAFVTATHERALRRDHEANRSFLLSPEIVA